MPRVKNAQEINACRLAFQTAVGEGIFNYLVITAVFNKPAIIRLGNAQRENAPLLVFRPQRHHVVIMFFAGCQHEHMTITIAKEQMIAVVNRYEGFAVKGIIAVFTCFSNLLLKLAGIRTWAVVIIAHTFIRCLRPLPRFAVQGRQVGRRNEDIARPSSVVALHPFLVPYDGWYVMPHTFAMNYAPATVELCRFHHFFVTAIHPFLPFLFFHLMSNQEAAPVAFAIAELSGIKGHGIEGHHAKSMRQTCGFVYLSLVPFAVGQ